MILERIFSPRLSRRSSPENPSTNLSDPDSWFIDYMNGGPTASGTRVSAQTALKVVTLRACINILSSTLASLPLVLYRRTANNGRERATNHPLYYLLHSRPNRNHTSYTFRSVIEANRNIYGDGFAFIGFDGGGNLPLEVQPLRSGQMAVDVRDSGEKAGEIYYKYANGSRTTVLDGKEVLHFPGLNFDGVRSQSPVDACRDAIGLSMATEEFGAKYFANGHRWGGVLSHPGELKADGMQNLRESLSKVGRGLENAHNPLILEEGMTWKETAQTPADSQAIEVREFMVREMCRIYRIPTHFVAVEHSEPRSNVEQESLEFVIYTMSPIAVLWEQELNRKLLNESEQQDYFFEFNFDGLLRGDTKTRYEAHSLAVNNGFKTRNEVRATENMNAIEGGDELTAQVNLAPLSMLGKQAEAAPPPSPPEQKSIEHLRPIFRAAFQRLAEKEGNAIENARKKSEKKGVDYYDWLKKFYADHTGAVRMAFGPLAETVGAVRSWTPDKIGLMVDAWAAPYLAKAVDDASWCEPEKVRARADALLGELAKEL